MNVFEAIRRDHNRQRNLVDALIQTHGDSHRRHQIFQQLKDELEAHAVAEERAFYVPLIEDDLTQEKARHSIAEHHELDELLEELSEMDFSSAGWLVRAKELRERVLHHLAEEEQEVFQLAGKALSDDQKEKLTQTFKDEKQEALCAESNV